MNTQSNIDVVSKTTAELHVYADGTLGNDSNDGFQRSAGAGGSLSVLAGVVTFVGTGAAWTTADVGKLITINYATNPDNNGSFIITGLASATSVTFNNARGVNDLGFTGRWAVSSPKKTLAAVFALVPYKADHNVCVHLSGAFTEAVTAYLERLVGSTVVVLVDGGLATTPVSMITGFGDSFSGSAGLNTTLTDALANFTANLVGQRINITGSLVAANNGLFTISGFTSSTVITLARTSGTFTNEPSYTGWYQIVPFDTTLSGTGDSFVFTAGPNTVDLTDAGASFTQADVGKQITVAGSITPANDGTFTITVVVSATQVTWVNASGATEAFAGTWTLGSFVANATTSTAQGLDPVLSSWKRDQYLGSIIEVLSGTCAGQNRLCVGYDEPVTNNTVLTGANTTFATSVATGNTDQFTYNPTGNVVTLTDNSALFTADMVGQQVVVAGATSPGNNGTFTVTAVLTPSTLTYVNAAPGVTEAGVGTWTITTVTLTAVGSNFNQLLRAPIVVNQVVIGTKITISGATTPANDGTYVISDVVSPTVIKYGNAGGVAEAGAGTWALQRDFQKIGTDVYLTDAGMEQPIRVTGKVITISGSTTPANDGPFTITEWVTPNILKYTNAGGASENFPGTWSTQGWLTPSRDFSAPPGAAQFRFVRPTTKVTAAQIAPRNDGGSIILATTAAGTIQFQSLTLDGTGRIWGAMSRGGIGLTHLFTNLSATNFWPFQIVGYIALQLTGNRVNPYTFALESANTTSQVGVSTHAQIVGVPPLVTIRCLNVNVQQSYIVAWPNAGCQSVSISNGARFGCVNMFSAGIGAAASAFGSILNSASYAKTRFTGCEGFVSSIPGKYNAALGLMNTNMHIGAGVDFTTLPQIEIGIELVKSFVISLGIQTGVAAKIGLYLHSGSCWMQQESLTLPPWIRGKTIGDVSVDRVTRRTTWEQAFISALSDTTEFSQIKRGYTSLY